jgi:hypothetical protein
LTRLRGRSRFGEARASIEKERFRQMDCRVKPGNDGLCFNIQRYV